MAGHKPSSKVMPFSGNFLIPSSQNFLSFEKSGTEIFFPLREFLKTETDRNLKVQHLVNTMDESERLRQDVTLFPWSSNKHVVLCYPDRRLCIFCSLISDMFLQCCFQLV